MLQMHFSLINNTYTTNTPHFLLLTNDIKLNEHKLNFQLSNMKTKYSETNEAKLHLFESFSLELN